VSKSEASIEGVALRDRWVVHSARRRVWISGWVERSQRAHVSAEAVVSWLLGGVSVLHSRGGKEWQEVMGIGYV